MLNFLKKLFLSNKYSLLVLLILSLWLKLVKDYNILLSYLVLIVLYLFVGIIVEMVLERFFPGFNAPRHAERRHEEADDEEPAQEEAQTAKRAPRREIRQSMSAEKPGETVRTRLPERRSSVDQSGIQERARKLGAEDTPKVTSSYIKNAGSIPREMEKKLVRTAADFHSIKQASDHLYSGERSARSRYANTEKLLADENLEDLYKNRKRETPETAAAGQNAAEETAESVAAFEEKTENREKSRPTMQDISFEPAEDYRTATSDELDKISNDISREVERRVTAPRPVRRTRLSLSDDLSASASVPPARPRSQASYAPQQKEAAAEKAAAERPARREREKADDKVSADMEKIDRLFNRNRGDSDDEEEPHKTGIWDRFKKKR